MKCPHHRLRHLLFNIHPTVIFVLKPKIVLVRPPNNHVKAISLSVWFIDEVISGGISKLIGLNALGVADGIREVGVGEYHCEALHSSSPHGNVLIV